MSRTTCISLLLLSLQLLTSSLSLRASLLNDKLPVTETQLPHSGLRELQARLRLRRKTPNVDTSSPKEYMIRLRDSLTDTDGKPRTDTDDPTNVWCLLDKDLIDVVYRPRPSSAKCRTVHLFRFNMKSLLKIFHHSNMLLQKGMLRTYLDVIPRYLRQDRSIPVTISSSFSVFRDNTTLTIFGGEEDQMITTNSSGWTELNVTQGLMEIQTMSELSDIIEVTVTITVNCTSHKKVPLTLVDPSSVPLSQGPRRLRLSKLQPMLLIYLSDENLKEELKKASTDPTHSGEDLDVEEIEKRSTSGCHLEDYIINFHNIDLDYVLAPYEYNARYCTGLCSYSVLRYQGNIATNHAKIIASAYALQNRNSPTLSHQLKEPCCVPIRYDPMQLLTLNYDELNYAVYPAMSVSACGCR